MRANKTQGAAILAVLIQARGREVSLAEILDLNIAQFGARILELRRKGFRIMNRTEVLDGKRLAWYRLANSPAPRPAVIPEIEQDKSPTLFEVGPRFLYPD